MLNRFWQRQQNYNRANRSFVYLILCILFVCSITGAGAGYAFVNQLSSDIRLLLVGATYFLIAFVVIASGLSFFVLAYSTLRKQEEGGEDKREIAILKRDNESMKLALEQGKNWVLRPSLPAQAEEVLIDYQDVDFE